MLEIVRPRSPADTTGGTGMTARPLCGCPAFDVGLEPDLHAAVAEVEDGSWHIRVPMLVHAHGIAVREAKQLCHAIGVDEIIDVDSLAHAP